MLSGLADKGKYSLRIIAYRESPEEIPAERIRQYQIHFDKYPGIEAISAYELAAGIVQPKPGEGLKTDKGVLVKWNPRLENHSWKVRIVKTGLEGIQMITAYLEEILPKSEYLIGPEKFLPEDEDYRVDISISSAQSKANPVHTYFFINNNNRQPNAPELEKVNDHVVRWEAMGDPDFDRIACTLVIEESSSAADTEPAEIKKITVDLSDKKDLIKELKRLTGYKCYIIAEDSWGLKARSEVVFMKLDSPPRKPVFKVTLDKKKQARAKKIIVTHENFDPNIRYQYYSKFFLKDGRKLPSANQWYSERVGTKKKKRHEFPLRVPGNQIAKVAIAVRASNSMGERVETTVVFPKPPRPSANN